MRRFSATFALIFFMFFIFVDDAVTCVLMPIPDECLEVFEGCDNIFVLDAEPTCVIVVSGCGGCSPPTALVPDLDPDYPHEILENSKCKGCSFIPLETRPVIVEFRIFQYQHENSIALPDEICQADISGKFNDYKSTFQGIHLSIPSTVLRC
ncbi:MAG: hypothetical protein ABIE07_12670 [Candidatus Zixiibacteriota bacterium]